MVHRKSQDFALARLASGRTVPIGAEDGGGVHDGPPSGGVWKHCQDAVCLDPIFSTTSPHHDWVWSYRANRGRDYQPKGQPERVNTHDFPDKQLGKICPYGVYDPTHNRGWVSVGIDHDTAQFAVESIRRWWWHMGQVSYPQAHALLKPIRFLGAY